MKQSAQFVREHLPYLKVRKNHVLSTWNGQTYEVPSAMFPVLNKPTLKVFTYANTEMLAENSVMATIYDQLDAQIGRCYGNMEKLAELLLKNNQKDFKIYTGWLFSNSGIPIHHCWIVYKDRYVLDPSVSLIDDWYFEEILNLVKNNPDKPLDKDTCRQLYVALYKEHGHKPNSVLRTFGQVAPFTLYVGTETTPNQGRKIFTQLTEQYPTHPSYVSEGMNQHGVSKVQKMMLGKE